MKYDPKFNVGIRVDWQNTPYFISIKTPEFAGYRNKINDAIINPRVGFNYNIDDAGKYILKVVRVYLLKNAILFGTRMNIISRNSNITISTFDQQDFRLNRDLSTLESKQTIN
jgi:hypothetical protein